MSKITGKVIQVFVFLAAYSFIVYKLYEQEDLWLSLKLFNKKETYWWTTLSFALMPLNWLIEGKKWQKILENLEKISLLQSFKSIIIGLTVGIITPSRIGEVFGRISVLRKENYIRAILLSFTGGFSMLLVIITLGFTGLYFSGQELLSQLPGFQQYSNFFLLLLILLYLFTFTVYFNISKFTLFLKKIGISESYVNKLRAFNSFGNPSLLIILTLSFVRYFIFTLQYYFLLLAFDVNITFYESINGIFIIYLLNTFIPVITLAEIGVRGSLAIIVFGFYTQSELNVLLAGSVLWLINIGLPAASGVFLYSFGQHKIDFENFRFFKKDKKKQ